MGKNSNKKTNKSTIKQNNFNEINNFKNSESNKNIKNSEPPTSSKNKEKKKHRKKKKPMSKFKKFVLKLIFFIVIILLIIFFTLQIIDALKWQSIAKQMCTNTNSIVLDINGNTIASIGNEKIHKNLDKNSMPTNLKNAYVSIEDERFYKHNGVDLKRTGSAIFSYAIHFGKASFGGSSITQQLVKNLTVNDENSINRKVNEWLKAVELEACMSKDDILNSYLNIIYVGPNIYGVEMGSEYYFRKNATDLSLAECAFLAGINHSPNYYNPFTDTDKSEQIKKRTKLVLNKMLELKYINNEDYNNAIYEVDAGLNFKKGEVLSDETIIYSYHTDAVISEAISDICNKKKIDREFATNYLYMGGLTIQSTQDTSIQNKMEEEFEKKQYQIASKNIKDTTSQAAMVMIDQNSRICCRGCRWTW